MPSKMLVECPVWFQCMNPLKPKLNRLIFEGNNRYSVNIGLMNTELSKAFKTIILPKNWTIFGEYYKDPRFVRHFSNFYRV